jgi:CRP/FNR family transcriptional regulator
MSNHEAARVDKPAAPRVACQDCSLFQLCLPIGLDPADLELLDRIIQKRRAVKPGEHLFCAGDPLASIFVVKSGSFKTFLFAKDGIEQVMGMYLPGELFGLDAIGSGVHHCSAVALERSAICELPYDRLEVLGARIPSLLRHMLRIMSKEMVRDKRILQRSKGVAEARLAAFLLSIGERLGERGFARDEYRLSMSRVDIGNYLGLADETVSRQFTRFRDEGLLMVERRHIRLLDLPRLQALAHGETATGAADAPRLLAWEPMYDIGVAAIDEQHRRLFDISNRLYDAWRQHHGRAALCRIVDELVAYTDYHFGEEERLMERTGYPGLEQHRRAHAELVALVRSYRTRLQTGTPGVEAQVLALVKTWLNVHVLEDDRDIGDHLRRTTSPGAAPEADRPRP